MARNDVEIKVVLKGNAASKYISASKAMRAENKKMKNSMDTMKKSSMALRAGYLAIATVVGGAVARSFIDTQKNIDRINNTLKVAKGSTADAAKEFTFLQVTARRLGLEFESIAQSYAQFAAASKNSTLSTEEQRKIFVGVAEASAAMGLSADDASGAMRALQQMMSKGKVQAEELRGQLGERIPGAFSMAAKAMGLTEKQLNKQLELGNVLASDLLPRLAQEMSDTFGEQASKGAEQLNGSINAMKNSMFELKKVFLEAGGGSFLSSAFRFVGKVISAVTKKVLKLMGYFQSLKLTLLEVDLAMAKVNFLGSNEKQVAGIKERIAETTKLRDQYRKNAEVHTKSSKVIEENNKKQKKTIIDPPKKKGQKENQFPAFQDPAFLRANLYKIQQEERAMVLSHQATMLQFQDDSRKKEIAQAELKHKQLNLSANENAQQLKNNREVLRSELAAIDTKWNEIEKQKNRELYEAKLNNANVYLQMATTLMMSLGQLSSTLAQNEVKDAERSAKSRILLAKSEGKSKQELANIQIENQKMIDQANKSAFEKQQRFALASAIVGTAQAVVNGLAMQPFPVGVASAAIAGAAGAVQIAAIQNQQFRDGGIANGPQSGYQVTMHGQEAVIPLKNGAVPVRLEGGGGGTTVINNYYGGVNSGSSSIMTEQEKLQNLRNSNQELASLGLEMTV